MEPTAPSMVRKGTIHKPHYSTGKATSLLPYAWLAKMYAPSDHNVIKVVTYCEIHQNMILSPDHRYFSFPKDISYFPFLETTWNPTQRPTVQKRRWCQDIATYQF